MADTKPTRKELVDLIQSKISLQIGKNFTQQEVVDLCIQFAQKNIDKLISHASIMPRLTPKLAEQILKRIESLPDVPYENSSDFGKEHDREIFSI